MLRGKTKRHLMFGVGNFTFSIPIEGVLGLSRCEKEDFEPPRTGEVGRMNFRGRMYPALDLEKKWKIRGAPGPERFLLVVSTRYCSLGLCVGRIGNIRDIDDEETIPYPQGLKGKEGESFHSLYPLEDGLAVIVDRERLISHDSLRDIETWGISSAA